MSTYAQDVNPFQYYCRISLTSMVWKGLPGKLNELAIFLQSLRPNVYVDLKPYNSKKLAARIWEDKEFNEIAEQDGNNLASLL